MKRRTGAALAALAGCALLTVFLYASIASVAFDTDWYGKTQERLGVEESGREEMNREMAAYLAGDLEELSERFNMQEKVHMEDVLALFQGGRTIACAAGVLYALCLAAACFFIKPSGALRAAAAGSGLFFLALAALGLWAAVDFSAWFTAMHEWVFSNDLWLFDPAQSRMIRILPLEFFLSAVTEIAVRFFALTTMEVLLSLAIGKGLKSREL